MDGVPVNWLDFEFHCPAATTTIILALVDKIAHDFLNEFVRIGLILSEEFTALREYLNEQLGQKFSFGGLSDTIDGFLVGENGLFGEILGDITDATTEVEVKRVNLFLDFGHFALHFSVGILSPRFGVEFDDPIL